MSNFKTSNTKKIPKKNDDADFINKEFEKIRMFKQMQANQGGETVKPGFGTNLKFPDNNEANDNKAPVGKRYASIDDKKSVQSFKMPSSNVNINTKINVDEFKKSGQEFFNTSQKPKDKIVLKFEEESTKMQNIMNTSNTNFNESRQNFNLKVNQKFDNTVDLSQSISNANLDAFTKSTKFELNTPITKLEDTEIINKKNFVPAKEIKSQENGFRSSMQKFTSGFVESVKNNNEVQKVEKPQNKTNTNDQKFSAGKVEPEYPPKTANDEIEEDYENDAFVDEKQIENIQEKKEGKMIVNVDKRKSQLQRVKDLKNSYGIRLEESYYDNMFNLEVVNKSHTNLEKLAQGHFKNSLVQTFETTEFGIQTEKLALKDQMTQVNDNNETEKNLEIDSEQNDETINYQPLSYEAYKFFIKFSPSIEKILLSNINKKILTDEQSTAENSAYSKLVEFKFPQDLIKYLNINNIENYSFTYNDVLFFDSNPSILAFSYTLKFESDSNVLTNEYSSTNLIIILNILSGKIDKILFSFSKSNCLALLGDYDELLISGNQDGLLDIYDLKGFNEKYYLNFEIRKNLLFEAFEFESPKYKLKLPNFSSSTGNNTSLIKLKKKKIGSNSYKLFALDIEGNISIWEIHDKDFREILRTDCSPLKKVKDVYLSNEISKIKPNVKKIKTFHFEVSKLHSAGSTNEILYILTNKGLLKVQIDSTESSLMKFLIDYDENENRLTAFSNSDNGYILLTYDDSTIKILEENSNTFIYNTCCLGSVDSKKKTVFRKAYWPNIICKNENNNNKLERRDLLLNIYLLSYNNEFIYFDFTRDLKKEKKKLELGKGKNLTFKNSQVYLSECIFFDFSNHLALTNEKDNSLEVFRLSLRNKHFEFNKVESYNKKILEKISKS